jgi:hypothetical protein
MLPKKIFRLLIALVAFAFVVPAVTNAQGNMIRWVVEKNSTLCVEGNSNINSFSCNINKYNYTDTLLVSTDHTKPVRLSGDLQMNVLAFDCDNSLITKDLRKTLKSDDYPMFSIRFLSLNCMPVLSGNCEYVKGWVEVELAGIVKRFAIDYSISKANTGLILLNGKSNFCFSDFNLSPPRKLAGLIKIKDDFVVKFKLVLRTI